ncbi:response regulator [Geomonas sp. RF6]|uniref:response regulator n=1 Tax=Geomonas sp. RF6 TaxID=2897342 RepID=UPI001E37209B|nr:response regulator [Geomonas sp. RF6]UFS70451.1 response regulator [Geomonas sp. RF6]
MAKLALLYVEDDPVGRGLISKAISLKFPQMTLLVAENGLEGLQLYKKHKPELVLTDMQMPVLDGISMASEIKRLQPDAEIILVSAYCDIPEYRTRSKEAGITQCIPKPVDHRKLFSAIEKSIAEAEREIS